MNLSSRYADWVCGARAPPAAAGSGVARSPSQGGAGSGRSGAPGLGAAENLHALKRSLAYANEGAFRRRHHEQQTEQMWCLNIAANAVVTWTSEYNGLAVTALRRAGRDIDDAVLAHIWPTHHENVHFYGTHAAV